jgi:hypothetical protein
MGEARKRGSYLARLDAARQRAADDGNRVARLHEAFSEDVQRAAKRIGLALGITSIMTQVPTDAAVAAGASTPTETRPARVVLVVLDTLLERLAMMERAVDAACPRQGDDPACQCPACRIRVAAGMLFRAAPVAEEVETGLSTIDTHKEVSHG